MVFAFVVALIILACVLIAKKKQKSSAAPSTSFHAQREATFAPPQNNSPFTAEEQKVLADVQNHFNKRDVTADDVETYIIDSIDTTFQSMDGWREWDKSVHVAPGQVTRIRRAAVEKLKTMCYDARYKIGVVEGSSGDKYLVSAKRCSCPDYRDRRLPCKHMYSLAMTLDGNDELMLNCDYPKPFSGLRFGLAGRFSTGKDDPNGVRAIINRRGGVWDGTLTPKTSVVVMGVGATESKIAYASQYDMVIWSETDVCSVFSEHAEDD